MDTVDFNNIKAFDGDGHVVESVVRRTVSDLTSDQQLIFQDAPDVYGAVTVSAGF